MRALLVVVLLAAACDSSTSTPPTDMAMQQITDPTTGLGDGLADSEFAPDFAPSINCAPGVTFCDGSQLWTCTKSGHDALLKQDCAAIPTQSGNSAENPFICAADKCTAYSVGVTNGGACCRKTVPAYDCQFAQPVGFSLTSYDISPPRFCNRGSIVDMNGQSPAIIVSENLDMDNLMSITIPLPASAIKVGGSATLAQIAGTGSMPVLNVRLGGKTCFSWSGTVFFMSDVPTWKFTLDLRCMDMGSMLLVSGVLTGTR